MWQEDESLWMFLCKLNYWKLSKQFWNQRPDWIQGSDKPHFLHWMCQMHQPYLHCQLPTELKWNGLERFSSSPMYLSIHLCLAIGLLSNQSLHSCNHWGFYPSLLNSNSLAQCDFQPLCVTFITKLWPSILLTEAAEEVKFQIIMRTSMLRVMDFWPPPALNQKWARHTHVRHLQTRIDIPPEPFKTCLWHHHQAHNPSTLQFKTIYCIHE